MMMYITKIRCVAPVCSVCWAFTVAKKLRKVLAAHEVNPLLANSLQGRYPGLLPRPQVHNVFVGEGLE